VDAVLLQGYKHGQQKDAVTTAVFLLFVLVFLIPTQLKVRPNVLWTRQYPLVFFAVQPPEAMRGTTFSMATDVYSFGVVSVSLSASHSFLAVLG